MLRGTQDRGGRRWAVVLTAVVVLATSVDPCVAAGSHGAQPSPNGQVRIGRIRRRLTGEEIEPSGPVVYSQDGSGESVYTLHKGAEMNALEIPIHNDGETLLQLDILPTVSEAALLVPETGWGFVVPSRPHFQTVQGTRFFVYVIDSGRLDLPQEASTSLIIAFQSVSSGRVQLSFAVRGRSEGQEWFSSGIHRVRIDLGGKEAVSFSSVRIEERDSAADTLAYESRNGVQFSDSHPVLLFAIQRNCPRFGSWSAVDTSESRNLEVGYGDCRIDRERYKLYMYHNDTRSLVSASKYRSGTRSCGRESRALFVLYLFGDCALGDAECRSVPTAYSMRSDESMCPGYRTGEWETIRLLAEGAEVDYSVHDPFAGDRKVLDRPISSETRGMARIMRREAGISSFGKAHIKGSNLTLPIILHLPEEGSSTPPLMTAVYISENCDLLGAGINPIDVKWFGECSNIDRGRVGLLLDDLSDARNAHVVKLEPGNVLDHPLFPYNPKGAVVRTAPSFVNKKGVLSVVMMVNGSTRAMGDCSKHVGTEEHPNSKSLMYIPIVIDSLEVKTDSHGRKELSTHSCSKARFLIEEDGAMMKRTFSSSDVSILFKNSRVSVEFIRAGTARCLEWERSKTDKYIVPNTENSAACVKGDDLTRVVVHVELWIGRHPIQAEDGDEYGQTAGTGPYIEPEVMYDMGINNAPTCYGLNLSDSRSSYAGSVEHEGVRYDRFSVRYSSVYVVLKSKDMFSNCHKIEEAGTLGLYIPLFRDKTGSPWSYDKSVDSLYEYETVHFSVPIADYTRPILKIRRSIGTLGNESPPLEEEISSGNYSPIVEHPGGASPGHEDTKREAIPKKEPTWLPNAMYIATVVIVVVVTPIFTGYRLGYRVPVVYRPGSRDGVPPRVVL